MTERSRPGRLLVSADHPALRDHFPGAPIPPGALLLQLLLDAAEDCYPERRICGVEDLKFLRPLEVDLEAEVWFDLRDDALDCEVRQSGSTVIRGSFKTHPDSRR